MKIICLRMKMVTVTNYKWKLFVCEWRWWLSPLWNFFSRRRKGTEMKKDFYHKPLFWLKRIFL